MMKMMININDTERVSVFDPGYSNIPDIDFMNIDEMSTLDKVWPIMPSEDYDWVQEELNDRLDPNDQVEYVFEYGDQADNTSSIRITPKRKKKTAREKINDIVRKFAKWCDGLYREAWNNLYKAFRAVYHVDLKRRARNREYKRIIDYVEEYGFIDALLGLALKLYKGC